MSMLFLVAMCAQTTPVAPPEPAHAAFAQATGPHFQVEVRFASQLAADQALAAAEWTVSPAESVFGPNRTDAGHPIARHIVVYATQAEYDAEWKARDEAHQKAEGTFGLCSVEVPHAPHPSVRDRNAHTSYVLVAPELALSRLATLGLPMETRRLIATEAAHLLADEALTDPDHVAPWFVEGAAEWAAEEGFAAAGWVRDRMEEPAFGHLALMLPVLANMSSLPALETIVTGLPGGLSAQERPAVDGAVFRFLKDPARAALFARIAHAARAFHETDGGDAGLRTAMGDDAARAALETAFRAYVAALDPKWVEIAPAMWSSGSNWMQVATPDENAVVWRAEPAGSDRWVLEGELEIQSGPTQQMNVLVCNQGRDFVQVSFVAGYGIDVFEFRHDRPAAERWSKLATVAVKGLKTAQWTPFRLQADGGALSVAVGGKPACAAKMDARSSAGRWGLGVLAGSAGRWRNIGFGRL